MDSFDSLLGHVHDFGPYQRLLLAFVLLPGFVPVGFHAYNQLFMAASPDHWCRVPFLEARNLSQDVIKNIIIPLEERDGHKSWSQCEMHSLDESHLMNVHSLEDLVRVGVAQRGPRVPCPSGWVYDTSVYTSTIVTQWDVVCDRSFLPTLALVLLGLGGIVGTHLFGILQDSWGRKPAFFVYLTIQCAFGIGTGLAPNFWTWLVMRVGVGFTVPALMASPYLLAQEMVGPEKRTLVNILLNIAYSMGLMALAGAAYAFRDWRHLAFATTIPFISFFAFWWVMPESPRWLFAHGKLKQTEKILRHMAYINEQTLPQNFSSLIKEKYEESQASETKESKERREYGIRDLLFGGKILRRNTLIITFIWFTTMGVYVGLSYYAPALGGDEFLNFFLAGLAEMPTYLFLYPCLHHWGRRWTLFSSLILGGIACIATISVKDEAWVTLTLYCVGKFGISAGFAAIQQMATEIYPTVVRGQGWSFSNVVGMVGPALVPLVNYMGQEHLYLPLLTLGALMVLGGMAALGLPETLGRSLPQSLEDAEDFRVDCSLQSCCPRIRSRNKQKRAKSNGESVGPRICIEGASEGASGLEEHSFIDKIASDASHP